MKFTKLETLTGTVFVGSLAVKLAIATGFLDLLTKVGIFGGLIAFALAVAYDVWERFHPPTNA